MIPYLKRTEATDIALATLRVMVEQSRINQATLKLLAGRVSVQDVALIEQLTASNDQMTERIEELLQKVEALK